MLDKIAIKIQKEFNLKSTIGSKFFIIPLFTEYPVILLGTSFLANNTHPYDWIVCLWLLVCVILSSICLYYEKRKYNITAVKKGNMRE